MRLPTMWLCDMNRQDIDEQVQPPFRLRNFKWCLVSSLIFIGYSRSEKVLISLPVCAGWSEPLLVAHTTLLEISCCGSNFVF